MTTISYTSVPVDETGVADYVVPADTYVMNGDRVYAEPGDHIHGFRDKAGINFSVYTASDCPHPLSTERPDIPAPHTGSALLRNTGA